MWPFSAALAGAERARVTEITQPFFFYKFISLHAFKCAIHHGTEKHSLLQKNALNGHMGMCYGSLLSEEVRL